MNDPQVIVVTDPFTAAVMQSGLLLPLMLAAVAAIIGVMVVAKVWEKLLPRVNNTYPAIIGGVAAAWLVLHHMMVL
jgi:hypothetical protein